MPRPPINTAHARKWATRLYPLVYAAYQKWDSMSPAEKQVHIDRAKAFGQRGVDRFKQHPSSTPPPDSPPPNDPAQSSH